jgi:hypothetical protein
MPGGRSKRRRPRSSGLGGCWGLRRRAARLAGRQSQLDHGAAGQGVVERAGLVAMAGFYVWVALTTSATLSYGIIAAQMAGVRAWHGPHLGTCDRGDHGRCLPDDGRRRVGRERHDQAGGRHPWCGGDRERVRIRLRFTARRRPPGRSPGPGRGAGNGNQAEDRQPWNAMAPSACRTAIG